MRTNSDIKVKDYFNPGCDINEYIGSIKGEGYKDYRNRWAIASKMEKEFDFPLFLVFETMFKCNLNCVMCIHSSKNKKQYAYKGDLSFDKYKEIITEASKYKCPSLTIGGTSEPLLDKRICDMIEFADRSGFVDTMINTNATLLTEEISEKLIKSGLTRLRIGFDGATAKTYENIRIGASFDKVKENILNFLEIRNKMKAKFPVVRISCVHLSANDSEIDEFVGFWKNKADYVSLQRYKPHELTEERSFNQMGPGNKKEMQGIRCSQPFERVYIRGNGDVHACCSIVYGPKIGNILNNNIYNIWNCKKMKELRLAHKSGILANEPNCKKCLQKAYNIA